MARIVYITNGMASTLNSSLELSRRLAKSGHEVIYLSHIDLKDPLTAHGFQFIQLLDCQRIQEQFSADLKRLRSGKSVFKLFKILKHGLKARQQSISSDEIGRVIEKIDPQILLIDFEMHYAIAATHQLRIPTLLAAVWFTIFRSSGLPPMHTELTPPENVADGLRIKWAWWKLIVSRIVLQPLKELFSIRKIKRRFVPVSYATNQRSDLKAIAKAQQFPLSQMTSRTNWSNPHTYRDLPLLIFNVYEMELEHSEHPLEKYVGPMVCRRRDKTSNDSQWKTFSQQAKNHNQQLIYCSLGTFWSTDIVFLNKVIDAFRDRNDWALIVGLGGKARKKDLSNPPSNVLAMDYAPQIKILEHCDAAITHGGITSINECVACGVPMLVCQTGYVDQPGCKVRVEHHGLGYALDIKTVTSSQIENRLAKLLKDDDTKSRVDSMRQMFQKYETDRIVERLIESYLNH